MDADKLLQWYDSLYSRPLDLVSDYAGAELFLVEGDSLLLECFCNNKLDFSLGLQLLHATYLVERCLMQLHQRKCNFHLIFFTCNAHACIPQRIPRRLHSRYLLAREAIVHHLLHNLPSTVPSIQVKRFETYRCLDFTTYLASVGAYFLMCHDGAFPGLVDIAQSEKFDLKETDSDKQSASDPEKPDIPRVVSSNTLYLRLMIHWFISSGYNIALINSLECRDTKVMATIVEGSARRAREILNINAYAQDNIEDNDNEGSDLAGELDLPTDRETSKDEKIEPIIVTKTHTITAHVPPCDTKGLIGDIFKKLHPDGTSSSSSEFSQRDWILVISISVLLRYELPENSKILAAQAMLIHGVIIPELRLNERVVHTTDHQYGEPFLNEFSNIATMVLTCHLWKDFVVANSAPCDLADMLDGRLFLCILNHCKLSEFQKVLHQSTLTKYNALASMVHEISGVDLSIGRNASPTIDLATENAISIALSKTMCLDKSSGISTTSVATVLPFSHAILDHHLKPLSLTIEPPANEITNPRASKVFQELSHWHNHKRPLAIKSNVMGNTKLGFFAHRRNQFFMSEMREYAASLTNPTGGVLQPETLFVRYGKERPNKSNRSDHRNISQIQKPGIDTDCSAGERRNTKREVRSVREQAASSVLTKNREMTKKHLQNWTAAILTFEREPEYAIRYAKVMQHLSALPAEKKEAIELEATAYMVRVLTQLWQQKCRRRKEKEQSLSIVALIWLNILHIAKAKQGMTEEVAQFATLTIEALGLPVITLTHDQKRPLSFYVEPTIFKDTNIRIGLSQVNFQMIHAGPFFDRNIGSAPDNRVQDFEPDKWQRDILDEIDARRSLFVVAPTSAGKTFISFYAIKQVLEDDDDGVLVYVAPTKALVNQIAAEVQARFSKSFKYSHGKSVWAIHTRDYRINNPTGCQVLITVPHILQIMLLSPHNAKVWSPRVRRIIFDEIHCIGQADDGVIWEQLLLLAPCPIIALSATVGNPRAFNEWLTLTQKANGNELKMVEHKTRYSDLRKYIYQPPHDFIFNGLSKSKEIVALGLDECPSMKFVHPVASLIDRARGLPDDFALEPRDCLLLWNSMQKNQTTDFPVDSSLCPSRALPNVISKASFIVWEEKIRTLLASWITDPKSPFDAVLKELSKSLDSPTIGLQMSSPGEEGIPYSQREVKEDSLLDTTLPLICSLHEQGALPALIFNYDRSWCERICRHILSELQEAEETWKATSPTWKKKMKGWEDWKRSEDKARKGKASVRDEKHDMSKADQMRETASIKSDRYESFDPDQPIDGFHFANMKKLVPSEFQEYATQLKRRFVADWLISALKRGIGVHHAGMNRKYRQLCEMLFRKGYLRVVIATGTLALGINMPCKTVVFAGDSVYLTALSFRQAAGRAGRRGFDFLGNVVFQGVPFAKVCRLLSSKLPDLNGHFPITTTLVLRLLILLHESGQSPFAVNAVNSILSCPRIYLGGPEAKHKVLHHLRFSIEYLRRNHLLDKNGAPLNFAGCVSHLYYTESSSFAFHALLSGGYLHQLCKDIWIRPKETLHTLMLVLSHIFGRYYLKPSVLESYHLKNKKSPSVVVLPPLPETAVNVLHAHNQDTLRIYSAYVSTFIEQHIRDVPDRNLPLTGMTCGGDKQATEINTLLSCLPPVNVTSAFVALSGHGDNWNSISELCDMVRNGVWLEQAVVPYVAMQSEGRLLNAYLYDFFKHGNVGALEKDNMIRRGDIWFALNDFSLILATIVTSLENFLKLSSNADDALLGVTGSGDAHEEELDDNAFDADEQQGNANQNIPQSSPVSTASPTKAIIAPNISRPVKMKKPKVADSWEDELSETDSCEGNEAQDDDSKESHSCDFTGEAEGSEGVPLPAKEAESILLVLKAFKMLRAEFDEKFKAMWA